ncbi:MAG: radical SAM protein [Candidatus Atabeyarchaeum deiterrae]
MGQVKLKGIDLLPTYRCTSRCRHCTYRSSPQLTGEMESTDAKRYVEDAAQNGIEWIWVGGGEPFLCRDLLPDVALAAKEFNIPDVYMVTNAYWAKTNEEALGELRLLKEVGMTVLGISIDAFHQENIPLEHVRNLLAAANKVGLKRIEVSGQFLGSIDFDIGFNRTTEKNLKLLEEEGYFEGVTAKREVLRLTGRAADMLSTYLPAKSEEELKDGKCDLTWLPVESHKKLNAVEIDWQGNVTTCPGICIGNARKKGLSKILEDYDYREHPIIKTIVDEGPYGLLQQAKRNGYTTMKKMYVDACHMCYKARKSLTRLYPGLLKPMTCYNE